MRYKVKNFRTDKSNKIQYLLKKWLEGKQDISKVVSVNIWNDEKYSYCTVTYTEQIYYL